MTTGTQNPRPDAVDAKEQVREAVGAETGAAGTGAAGQGPQQPASPNVTRLWWLAAIVGVVSAAWLTVVVVRGTHFTTGQRAAAAGTALLVVVALAIVA